MFLKLSNNKFIQNYIQNNIIKTGKKTSNTCYSNVIKKLKNLIILTQITYTHTNTHTHRHTQTHTNHLSFHVKGWFDYG